jgi:hypothetical protein
MEKDKNQIQQTGIDITPDVAGGTYSNLAMVSHSPADFVVDFLCLLPGMPRPLVKSRIVMAPEHAKRLLIALNDNVKKYENMFGEIQLAQNQAPLINAFDKMPKGEA